MSKTKDIATLGSFDKALELDAKIDLNAVAAVFVAQWETKLFAKKKELSSMIKSTKDDIKILEATVKRSVDKSEYAISIPELGLIAKVESVEVKWPGNSDDDDFDDDDKIGITIKIEVTEKSNTARWGSESMNVRKLVKISKTDLRMHKTWSKEVDELNSELLETMASIKGVSRKTREITGVIAGKKLEAAGYTGLLDHPDLVKLIEVDPIG